MKKKDTAKTNHMSLGTNEQKDTGTVCAVSKSKKIVNTWDSWKPKTFHNSEGSSSDTSRDSAKQEPKRKNNSMFMHGRLQVRSLGSLPIDHESDLFKINKDIGGLVRARGMQQNGSYKARTRFVREKSDSDTTTLMEYAARATASHRKKPVENIRIELKILRTRRAGLFQAAAMQQLITSTTLWANLIWKLNLLGRNRTNLYIVDRKAARIYLGISPQSRANLFY